ncbi:MAG: hypothetical protein P8X89_12245 [Reinekea sp.]
MPFLTPLKSFGHPNWDYEKSVQMELIGWCRECCMSPASTLKSRIQVSFCFEYLMRLI